MILDLCSFGIATADAIHVRFQNNPNSVRGIEHRSHAEETVLIGQILVGRKELFDDLLEPHFTSLFRFVRSRMGSDSEAEDVIQVTILKAFTHLAKFRFEASFRSWLIRIAINEVAQCHRKRQSSRFLVLNQSALAQLQVADQGASPLKQCERRETVALFHTALARLPERYQILIRLRDLEDLSISEVAQQLCLSVPAVKTRHKRARLKMVNFLMPILRTSRSRQVTFFPA